MHVPSSIVAPAIGALVAMAIVLRRTLRPQTIRVWKLIALPVLAFVIAVWVLIAAPPASVAGAAVIVVGAAAGSAVGYARALHSRLSLGPKPGTVVVEGNAVLVAILFAALALRLVARAALAHDAALSAALTDAFVVFAAAMLGVARGLLYLRWRRLTAARPAAGVS